MSITLPRNLTFPSPSYHATCTRYFGKNKKQSTARSCILVPIEIVRARRDHDSRHRWLEQDLVRHFSHLRVDVRQRLDLEILVLASFIPIGRPSVRFYVH